jgi:hypothetical protein
MAIAGDVKFINRFKISNGMQRNGPALLLLDG